MQIALSDFLRDEGKNGENPLWIFEYFPEISRKICTQDACRKIRNRLSREICKQMACKVARRSLCGIALWQHHIGKVPDLLKFRRKPSAELAKMQIFQKSH